MKLAIEGIKVTILDSNIIGFVNDNLINKIEATTDLDESWEYSLLVHMVVENKFNMIKLSRNEQGLYVELTKDMLPFDGKYEMQFEYTSGDIVGHTEIFEVWVKHTIEALSAWENTPSDFEQIRKEIFQSALQAQNAVIQAEKARDEYPKIIENFWWIYNPETEKYEDTGTYIYDREETYVIDLKKFNIYKDGSHATETTNGINDALKYCYENNFSNIKFPQGHYLIDTSIEARGYEWTRPDFNIQEKAKGICLYSNQHINLNNSLFEMIPSSATDYNIFFIGSQEKTSIEDGEILGDLDTHITPLRIKDFEKGLLNDVGQPIDTGEDGIGVRTTNFVQYLENGTPIPDKFRLIPFLNVKGGNTVDGGRYDIFWYDVNNDFVSKSTVFWLNQVTKPQNAEKFKISISFGGEVFDSNNIQEVSLETTSSHYTREFGAGIQMTNCKNISLRNLKISKTTGDGITISNYSNGNSFDIFFNNLEISNCRRQGISFIEGQNIFIDKCVIHDIQGIDPQSGIDFEHYVGNEFKNIFLNQCKFYNNFKLDIISYNGQYVYVDNCVFSSNCRTLNIGATYGSKMQIKNCVFDGEKSSIGAIPNSVITDCYFNSSMVKITLENSILKNSFFLKNKTPTISIGSIGKCLISSLYANEAKSLSIYKNPGDNKEAEIILDKVISLGEDSSIFLANLNSLKDSILENATISNSKSNNGIYFINPNNLSESVFAMCSFDIKNTNRAIQFGSKNLVFNQCNFYFYNDTNLGIMYGSRNCNKLKFNNCYFEVNEEYTNDNFNLISFGYSPCSVEFHNCEIVNNSATCKLKSLPTYNSDINQFGLNLNRMSGISITGEISSDFVLALNSKNVNINGFTDFAINLDGEVASGDVIKIDGQYYQFLENGFFTSAEAQSELFLTKGKFCWSGDKVYKALKPVTINEILFSQEDKIGDIIGEDEFLCIANKAKFVVINI